jgi:small-conductance mechanosensitive channel
MGLTTLLPNLYAGIIIKTSEKFRNGQIITLKSIKAKVDKIYLFRTKLITNQGDTLYIGNSTLWRKGKLA